MIKDIFKKFKYIFLLMLTGLIACLTAFYLINRQVSLKDYNISASWFLENVDSSLNSREEMLENISLYGNYMNYDLIYNISYLFDGCDYQTLSGEALDKKNAEVQKKADDYDVDHLYVIDESGKIYIALDEGLSGKNLIEEGILTREELNKVIEGDIFETEEVNEYTTLTGIKEENLITKVIEGELCVFNSCGVYTVATDADPSYYAISATKDAVYEQAENILMDMSLIFDAVVPYDTFSALMIDRSTGIVTEASPEAAAFHGKTMQELGLGDLSELADGVAHTLCVGNERYTAHVSTYERKNKPSEAGYYIVTLKDKSSAKGRVIWLAIVLFLVSSLVLLSEAFVHQGTGKREMKRKLTVIMLILLLFNTSVTTYVWVMHCLSEAMEQCCVNASAMEESYAKTEELVEEVEEYYKDKKVAVLRAMAGYVEAYEGNYLTEEESDAVNTYYVTEANGNRVTVKDPLGNPTRSFSGNACLDGLRYEQSMNMLMILDQNGNTIASSGDGWYYELEGMGDEEGIEQLQMVLDKKVKGVCRLNISEQEGEVQQIVAVPLNLYVSTQNGETVYHNREEFEEDTSGKIKRLDALMVEDSNTDSSVVLSKNFMGDLMTTSLGSYLDAAVGIAVYDDEKEKAELKFAPETFDQDDLNALDLTRQDFVDDNYKFARYDGSSRFSGIVQMKGLDGSLITLLKTSDVLYGFWSIFLSTAVGFLLYIGVVAWCFVRREVDKPMETEEERESRRIRKERETLRGELMREERKQEATPSEEENKVKEEPKIFDVSDYIDKDASNRTSLLARGMLMMLMTYILVKVLIAINSEDAGRSLTYALSQRWTKGVHIFSISVIVYLILFLYVINSFIKSAFSAIASSLSSRVETMARLMISILQYGSIVGIIGYSMYLFGVETGTVITSAGILTAIIGFGSQSLVADVVSGIFIIIEREYMVGDIVTIDDFTGVVKEIGLRTTKLMDNCGSTKTFNNSEISGVLNLTENYSQCFVTFEISQSVPVAVIEKLVNEELYPAMAGNEMIVEGPWFSGIMNMSGGCYTVSIAARCLQEDVWRVQKEMYAKTLELLNKNGIETQ